MAYQPNKEKRSEPSLLPLQDMRRAILGSVVNLLASKLPTDEAKLADLVREGHDKFASRYISDGISGAGKSIGDYLQSALKNTTTLTNKLMASDAPTAKKKDKSKKR